MGVFRVFSSLLGAMLGIKYSPGARKWNVSLCGLYRLRRPRVVMIALPSTQVDDSLLQCAHGVITASDEMAKLLQCSRQVITEKLAIET